MKKNLKSDHQYRATIELTPTTLNKRIESDYYVEGYATKWQPYLLYEYPDGTKVYERFSKEAFAQTDMRDIILQFDHQGPVYARKSNKTLIVEVDDTGLFVAADLSKTQKGKELYDDIATGMITKMSWGFRPGDYHFDKETNTIEHKSIKKIFDVSAVSIPANENTELNVRSFSDGVIKKLTQERRAQAINRLNLKITTVIGKGK